MIKKWNEINRLLIQQKFNHKLLKNIIKYPKDHWIPQHLYYEKSNDYKIHILKFENLKNDFENLMKLYNLPLKLNKNSMKSPTNFLIKMILIQKQLI